MWFGKDYLGSCWKDLECKVQLSAICEVDADKIRSWPRREVKWTAMMTLSNRN